MRLAPLPPGHEWEGTPPTGQPSTDQPAGEPEEPHNTEPVPTSLNVEPTRIDTRQLNVAYLKLDPERVKLAISVQEELHSRAAMDHSQGTWVVDGQPVQDWSAVKKRISDHIRDYQGANPQHRIIGVFGNGNLFANDWFITYVHGKLFHRQGEPVEDRVYSCLVARQNGMVTIEDLQFSHEPSGWKVWAVSCGTRRDITQEVSVATYGQRVLQEEVALSSEELLYGQFSNLRHLLVLPGIRSPIGREHVFSSQELLDHDHPDRLRAAVRGEAVRAGGLEFSGLTVSAEQRDEAFRAWGYTQVESEDHVANRGEYYVHDDGSMTIKFKESVNSLTVVGVDPQGQVIVATVPGRTSREGVTFQEAAELIKAQGAHNAIVLSQGGDVFLSYHGNDIVPSWSGRTFMTSVVLVVSEAPTPSSLLVTRVPGTGTAGLFLPASPY